MAGAVSEDDVVTSSLSSPTIVVAADWNGIWDGGSGADGLGEKGLGEDGRDDMGDGVADDSGVKGDGDLENEVLVDFEWRATEGSQRQTVPSLRTFDSLC